MADKTAKERLMKDYSHTKRRYSGNHYGKEIEGNAGNGRDKKETVSDIKI